jgi:PKD repeat protein
MKTFKWLLIIAMGSSVLLGCKKKGCTDSYADNYEGSYTKDDGSCSYKPIIDFVNFTIKSCSAPYSVDVSGSVQTFGPDVSQSVAIFIDGVQKQCIVIGSSSSFATTITVDQSGNHTLKVIVTTSTGNDVEEMDLYISPTSTPTASFSSSGSLNACLTNGMVSFSNSSVYASTFLWTFGDGSTSTLEDPTHYYSSPGTYPVTLTADCNGNQDVAATTIVVSNVSLNADFSASATNNNYHAPAEVDFLASYSYAGASYKWYVGGTLVSTAQTLSNYQFNSAGTYTVQLEITCGASTNTQTYNVTIQSPYTGVHIKKVKFWFPSGTYDKFWYQHYEDGTYTAQSYYRTVASNWTWLSFTDSNISWGNLNLYNFNSINQSAFQIWTEGGAFGGGGVVKTYTFSPYQLDDWNYPTVLNWASSGGFDFQLELEYF